MKHVIEITENSRSRREDFIALIGDLADTLADLTDITEELYDILADESEECVDVFECEENEDLTRLLRELKKWTESMDAAEEKAEDKRRK